MDPIKLNKLLASILKSRDIQKKIVQERAFEQAGFHDYALKFGAPTVKKEDKNTNMITDKLHENDTDSRRRFQRLNQSLSSVASFQASNQAHLSQAILPPNKHNFIANVDSDEELLREINKDYDPKGFYFQMPKFYLESYQYLKSAIDKSGTLNQRYGGKMKAMKSSELEKCLSS